MARKESRKKRIKKAVEEIWTKYTNPHNMLIHFGPRIMRITDHYRDEYYIRPHALRDVAADYDITVDELREVLAQKVLVDRLYRATGV